MSSHAELDYPVTEAPAPGSLTPIAPGVLWLRLALPFALNHVNVYLIEDGDGWAAVDTGLGDAATREVWERVLDGRRLTRIICTHFHPDHAGQVGWLTEHTGAELLMPRTEYLFTRMLQSEDNHAALESPAHLAFFRRHGLAPEAIEALIRRGHAYLRVTTGMPTQHRRIAAGGQIEIGGRIFEVLTGGGHAAEQAMLFCREARLFFAADQVLARISPNISVWAWEPHEDPLRAYLESLADIRARFADDALVLPAHNLPFRRLHARVDELMRHHAERCAIVAEACRGAPLTAAEILPIMFTRPLDPQQTGFAFGETLAHVNYMLGRGEIRIVDETDGVQRMQAA